MTDETTNSSRSLARRRVLLGAAAGGAMIAAAKPAVADEDDDRVHDYVQIQQLSVNYALGTDAIGRDDKALGLALYEKTFTANAEIMVAGAPSTLRIGAAAWADFVESVFRGNNYDRTQHLIGTISVTNDRDRGRRAHMSTYLHATHHVADNSALLVVLGTYDDVVVRVRGRWRIAKRTLSVMTSWNETPN